MPYPFQLPTTSATPLTQSLTSSTHPSLPLTATTHRNSLRHALKSWKRTPPAQQQSQLPQLISIINAYLPYLFALDAGLSGKPVAGEELDVVLVSEVVVEWRPILSSTSLAPSFPSSNKDSTTSTAARAGRLRLKSLESEVAFVLLTLALAHILQARAHLHVLLSDGPAAHEAGTRASQHAKALRSLLDAHAVLTSLLARSQTSPAPSAPDISPGVISALAQLTLADATLTFVAKDDPYPAALAQSRSKTDSEWMYKAPSLPKVRAGLFARCCLQAATYAGTAHAQLASASASATAPAGAGAGAGKLDDALVRYADDVRATSRAKAARLLGVDAEADARVGVGLGYLRGARAELGLAAASASGDARGGGFNKLRSAFKEKREERKISAGAAWGADGGRAEEGRVVVYLEEVWTKTNDTIGVQSVPGHGELLANLPSGRDALREMVRVWKAPVLDAEEMVRMRAPPGDGEGGGEVSSGEDEREVPGAFPEGGGSYY